MAEQWPCVAHCASPSTQGTPGFLYCGHSKESKYSGFVIDNTKLIERCIDSLYMSLCDPESLSLAASSLRSLFNAGAACLFTVDDTDRVLSFAADGIVPEDQQRWVQHYSDVDPMRPFALASKPGQWMTNDDLLHPVRTTSPEYVHDFARGAGIRWFGGGKVAEDPGGSSFFTLQRPHNQKPFDNASLALLDTLLPHLQRAARLRMVLRNGLAATMPSSVPIAGRGAAADASSRSFDPAGALDALAVGVCIVDIEGRIKFANKAASSLLARKGFVHSLRSGGDRLELEGSNSHAKLRLALARACRRPRTASAFSVPWPDATQRLLVRVLPTQPRADLQVMASTSSESDALVFFSAGPPQLRADVLEQLHDLTSAEAALVRLLAQGLTPQACAQARGVSLSTVRAQLSSVLAKTGAATQSQLLSMVLAMSALP